MKYKRLKSQIEIQKNHEKKKLGTRNIPLRIIEVKKKQNNNFLK